MLVMSISNKRPTVPPPSDAEGDLQAEASLIVGAGAVISVDAGALVVDASVIQGAGVVPLFAEGELQAASSVVDGSGQVHIIGEGDLQVDASLVDGTGTYSAATPEWQVLGSWDHAVSGNTASPIDFNGLGGCDELMVIYEDLERSISGITSFQLSVDNGVSFFSTSGNYRFMTDNGSPNNFTAWRATNSNATTDTSGMVHIMGNTGAVPKTARMTHTGLYGTSDFVGSLSAVDAIRVFNSGGGNYIGGRITVLGYK